jgi:hypothetical protein
MLGHSWADPRASIRSYELIARRSDAAFQATRSRALDAAARARAVRSDLAAQRQNGRSRDGGAMPRTGQVERPGLRLPDAAAHCPPLTRSTPKASAIR